MKMTITGRAMNTRRHRRLARTLAIAVAASLATASVAWGHAVLVRSSPANRAVVAQAPSRVQLWFNERIEPAYARLTIVDAQKVPIDSGEVIVGPEDPRLLAVALPALEPGQYTARYRVLSVDGHIVEGEVTFTVRSRR
jgi:copper resistance protein C